MKPLEIVPSSRGVMMNCEHFAFTLETSAASSDVESKIQQRGLARHLQGKGLRSPTNRNSTKLYYLSAAWKAAPNHSQLCWLLRASWPRPVWPPCPLPPCVENIYTALKSPLRSWGPEQCLSSRQRGQDCLASVDVSFAPRPSSCLFAHANRLKLCTQSQAPL